MTLTHKSKEVFGIKDNVFKLVYELFSCSIPNNHKLSALKQYTLAHSFYDSGVQAPLTCTQCSDFHKAVSQAAGGLCCLELGAPSQAHIVDRIPFLAAVGLRSQCSHWLSAPGACPWSPPFWPSQNTEVYFFTAAKSSPQSTPMESKIA